MYDLQVLVQITYKTLVYIIYYRLRNFNSNLSNKYHPSGSFDVRCHFFLSKGRFMIYLRHSGERFSYIRTLATYCRSHAYDIKPFGEFLIIGTVGRVRGPVNILRTLAESLFS